MRLVVGRKCIVSRPAYLLVVLIRDLARGVGPGTSVITIGMGTLDQVLQFKVGTLAVVELQIFFVGQLAVQVVEVGAIVGDVQLAVAVHKGEVAVAIESAYLVFSQCDEVLVEKVAHSGRGIAEHRLGIGIHLVGTRRHIAACKHGIADGDAQIVQTAPPGITVVELVQVCVAHIVALLVNCTVHRHILSGHAIGRHQHLAVLGQIAIRIVIPVCIALAARSRIHITDVAAAEHIAMAFHHAGIRADGAAEDVHLGLAEGVTVGIAHLARLGVAIGIDGIAASAAKHIVLHLSAIHLHQRMACLLNFVGGYILHLGAITGLHLQPAHGSNLAASIHAVAHNAAVELHQGAVHTGSLAIAAAIQVSALLEQVVGVAWHIHVILEIPCLQVVIETYAALLHGQMGGAPHCTPVTTAIHTAQNGRTAVPVASGILAPQRDVGVAIHPSVLAPAIHNVDGFRIHAHMGGTISGLLAHVTVLAPAEHIAANAYLGMCLKGAGQCGCQ